jgi:gas vesicle protein
VRILESLIDVKPYKTPKNRKGVDLHDINDKIGGETNFEKEHRMSEKHNLIGGIVLGILAGALIGSAITLLSAPQPGIRTRAMIQEKGAALRERASTRMQDTRIRADAVLNEVKIRSQEFAGKIKRSNGASATTEIIAE